jgi:hypothetical protein
MKGNGKPQWTNDAKFAQCDLMAADKPAFTNWLAGVKQDFPTLLGVVCNDGYRVGVKTDFNNNCYLVSFTQQDTKHLNNGIILTSRSDDIEEAFFLCMYKAYVMYEGQRLPTQSERPFWG